MKKWYTYQKERFPVITYALYVFCIVFAVFCFCNRNADNTINYPILIPMFIVTFLQFLIVRIIDEFKDYEEDCKYRPYRPVPRGLIKLNELKILFIISVFIQLVLTLIYNKNGLIFLILVWIYFALMSKEFFLKKVWDKHLLLNVAFDELLMPILVLYLASYINIDSNIWMILLMSYIINWIVEVARKVRCKEDEEKGVKTYTAVLGIGRAVLILFVLETLLMITQVFILGKSYFIFIIVLYMLINMINLLFLNKKNRKFAKLTELSANIYIIIVYLSMALLI